MKTVLISPRPGRLLILAVALVAIVATIAEDSSAQSVRQSSRRVVKAESTEDEVPSVAAQTSVAAQNGQSPAIGQAPSPGSLDTLPPPASSTDWFPNLPPVPATNSNSGLNSVSPTTFVQGAFEQPNTDNWVDVSRLSSSPPAPSLPVTPGRIGGSPGIPSSSPRIELPSAESFQWQPDASVNGTYKPAAVITGVPSVEDSMNQQGGFIVPQPEFHTAAVPQPVTALPAMPARDVAPEVQDSQESLPEDFFGDFMQDPERSTQEDESDLFELESDDEQDDEPDYGLEDLEDLEMDLEMDLEDEDDEPVTPQRYTFDNWDVKDIREIQVDVRDTNAVVPRDRSALLINRSMQDWALFSPGRKVYAWAAPNIRHQPLYFEDVALERYGQDRGGLRQVLVSGLHFAKSGFLLGYSAAIDHPYSCDYPLGYCRPGNIAPQTLQQHLYGWQRRR